MSVKPQVVPNCTVLYLEMSPFTTTPLNGPSPKKLTIRKKGTTLIVEPDRETGLGAALLHRRQDELVHTKAGGSKTRTIKVVTVTKL